VTGGDPKWVQHHELPDLIAELRGLNTCPVKLLADVREAIADDPDNTLTIDFGIWLPGQRVRDVPCTWWLDINWAKWTARVRPEHAEALGIGECDLRRTFLLVVTRAKVRQALAATAGDAPAIRRIRLPDGYLDIREAVIQLAKALFPAVNIDAYLERPGQDRWRAYSVPPMPRQVFDPAPRVIEPAPEDVAAFAALDTARARLAHRLCGNRLQAEVLTNRGWRPTSASRWLTAAGITALLIGRIESQGQHRQVRILEAALAPLVLEVHQLVRPADRSPAPTERASQERPRKAAPASAGGKPHPRRNYANSDAKLVAEMHRLLSRKREPAKDATDAARLVVKMAEGNSTEDSKIKRLVARYYKNHPKEPPPQKNATRRHEIALDLALRNARKARHCYIWVDSISGWNRQEMPAVHISGSQLARNAWSRSEACLGSGAFSPGNPTDEGQANHPD
jgi:hypothetical protein